MIQIINKNTFILKTESNDMIVERLPGLENKDDLIQTLKSLDSAIYWSRRSGRFEAADQFDKTFKAFMDIQFKKDIQ